MPAAALPLNEDSRLAALQGLHVLDSKPEPYFDDLVALAVELTGAPKAAVSLVDAQRQWFKACVGIDEPQTKRAPSFCAHTILSSDPLIVNDARQDPRFVDSELVTSGQFAAYLGAPIYTATGMPVGAFCVGDVQPRVWTPRDVRNIVRLAAMAGIALEHRVAQQRAEEANQAKGVFLTTMSHEIRTPLTAILGYADLIHELGDLSRAPKSRREAIDIIRRNGAHLLTLVNDIIDLARIESNRLAIYRENCDPAGVLNEALATVREHALTKGLTLQIESSGPVPATLHTDPTRVRQILTNLLNNAVKFTHKGSVRAQLHFNPGAPAGPTLRFEILDSGIGMSPAQMEHLFLPFSQAHSAISARSGGAGLGLAISRRLAELLGGTLRGECELDRGCRFILELPVPKDTPLKTVPANPPGEVSLKELPAPAATPAMLTGLRVLVVEDGPDNLRLINFRLTRAGAQVETATNGAEAIRRLTVQRAPDAPTTDAPTAAGAAPATKTTPAGAALHPTLVPRHDVDLVLMDMQMPEVDGYTATRVLRRAGFDRPIVALTAHAVEGERARFLDAGCTEYATKPVDWPSLIRLCRLLVEQHRAGAKATKPPLVARVA